MELELALSSLTDEELALVQALVWWLERRDRTKRVDAHACFAVAAARYDLQAATAKGQE